MKTTICLAIMGVSLAAAASRTRLPTPPDPFGDRQLAERIAKLEKRLDAVEGVYIRQAKIELRLSDAERRLADLTASHKADSVLWKILFLERHDAFGRHVHYPNQPNRFSGLLPERRSPEPNLASTFRQ